MEHRMQMLVKRLVLSVAGALLLHSALAQEAPELSFKNPLPEQGEPGEDGTVYRFRNITAGVDGLLKIKNRSHAAVVLEDVDVAGTGWEQALQPRLGWSGAAANAQTWWMQFELAFVQRGSFKKVALPRFAATAIDVDGDNVALREFVQMDGAKEMAHSSNTVLANDVVLPQYASVAAHNTIVGPVTSFEGMDTTATAVMATYAYENTDAITFTIGATSQSGMVGLRLNSLWFKPFSLEPQPTLPAAVETFAATYTGNTIKLSWRTADERSCNHFVVERSVNGRTYMDVVLIVARGSGRTYSYKDEPVMMPAGMAYYRLRVVDKYRAASHTSVSTVFAKGGVGTKGVALRTRAAESKGGTAVAWKSK